MRFFSDIPEESKFHDDPVNKSIYTIQYPRLTPRERRLQFLNKKEKELFGVALYFTVLTDMVCYTYFSGRYQTFQRLTRYPKFIGNCLSTCRYHYHPERIFRALNEGLRKESDRMLRFDEIFSEAKVVIEKEVRDFFYNHMPGVDAELFWNKCVAEFRE